jgi:hypothetical protein
MTSSKTAHAAMFGGEQSTPPACPACPALFAGRTLQGTRKGEGACPLELGFACVVPHLYLLRQVRRQAPVQALGERLGIMSIRALSSFAGNSPH